MTQERIYLTLKKEPGEPAVVVDQHGRHVAGVIGIRMRQRMDAGNVLRIEVLEKDATGNVTAGTIQQAKK